MKVITGGLFNELRRTSSNLTMGWLLTRTDGFQLGFTSYSESFVFNGVTYNPTNAFSGTAAVAKNNLSVDNMNAVVLISDDITEDDLKGGRWDNASVEVFWINPKLPALGSVPIRGGTLGEIKLTNGKFECELRSILQWMQQSYGDFFTLECANTLGDSRCKVIMSASEWAASTKYIAAFPGEASIGSIVKPSTYNGFWYMCTSAPNSEIIDWGTTIQGANTGTVVNPLELLIDDQVGAAFGKESDFTSGAIEEGGVKLQRLFGNSGTVEPTWPTTLGGTVVDNEITWTTIYAREVQGVVTGSRGYNSFVDVNRPEPAGYFQYGLLTWTGGANAGLRMEVRNYTVSALGGRAFDLLEPMPAVISVGDNYTVLQGCPKTRTKCSGSPTASLVLGFNNIHNMRAFPDMPTEDRALATPNFTSSGTQQQDSGGSKG